MKYNYKIKLKHSLTLGLIITTLYVIVSIVNFIETENVNINANYNLKNVKNYHAQEFQLININSKFEELKLLPGGHSIGIMDHSEGVIVIGCYEVIAPNGDSVSPASMAGVRSSDIIVIINGNEIRSEVQVRNLVAEAGSAGKYLCMDIKRGDTIFNVTVKPAYCQKTSQYRIGLLIKDSAIGIGTLTFFEPNSMIYGALGHIIADPVSTVPMDLRQGIITNASVRGINRAIKGQPGEKYGLFEKSNKLQGSIIDNTQAGIYGILNQPLGNPIITRPLPVAGFDQMREGNAYIMTVVNKEEIEKFSIEIIRINEKASSDGKGLLIKVTDPRLLEYTGGIIQGMSGSPILQDGRIVGAVTHVFVNDPTRGYGIPIEWMLKEMSLLPANSCSSKEQKIA